MNERVNLKFLGWSLAAFAVIAGGWFGVHAFQMRQHRDALLAQVDRAEEQGKSDRAVRLLGQYVSLAPEDVDARARYGIMLEESAGGRRVQTAASVYEQVLIRDPQRQDIRRRLARLDMLLRDFDEALTHLKVLEETFPKDAEVAELLGQCHEIKAEYTKPEDSTKPEGLRGGGASEYYHKAITLDPKRIGSYVRRARLLQLRLNQPKKADELMNDLVEKNKDSYQAYLERAVYWKEFHVAKAGTAERAVELAKAQADAAEARRLAPKQAGPLLLSADLAREKGDLKAARQLLEQGIQEQPQTTALYQGLAGVELADNHPKEAIAWLRRGLEVAPEEKNLLFALGQMMIQNGEREEVKDIIERLEKLKVSSIYPDYLKARLAFAGSEWNQATLQLEALLPALVDAPELATQTYMLLGQCYEHRGATDRQLEVYRRAIRADSLNLAVRYAEAVTLARLGRVESAIEQTRQLMGFSNAPASGWLLLARLLVAQNLSLPAKQQEQNWQNVEDALTQAEKAKLETAELPILQAEVLVAREKPEQAWQLLKQACDRQPRQIDLWTALADLALRQDKLDVAGKLLDDAEKAAGDSVELRLARARYVLRQKDKADPKALAHLADSTDKFELEDRARLLRGLADIYIRAGKTEEARRLWTQLAELLPQDLPVRLLLFDAAVRGDDEDAMREQLRAIRRIEEAGGPRGHFAAASHLFWKARKADKAGLTEARAELLAEARSELVAAAARRPGWDKISLLQASIAELEGKEDQAIENYLRAVEQGNRQFEVIGRLVRLLCQPQRQRYHDAELVLRRIPERTAFSAELQRVIAEVSLQTGDQDRALEAARKAVNTNSTDFHDHLWLGQMLWAMGRTKEAEPVLRRAVQLSGEVPDPWVNLVQFLARTNRVKEAEGVLHEAEGKLPRQKAMLAFAQCYEAVGKPKEAQSLYEEAVKAEPNNVTAHQGAANFYLRMGDRTKAGVELNKILELKHTPPDTAALTRRILAVVLAGDGDYEHSRQALELVGLLDKGMEKPEAKKADPEDLRVRAVVLANQRSIKQKQQAIEMLQELDGLRTLPPEEQFLLVQLYEAVGEPAKARDQMLRLLGTRADEPRYLAHQVQMLLRQGQIKDASLWFDRLEKDAPKAFRTVELKARLMKAKMEESKIVPLLTAYLRDNPTLPVLAVAILYENLGLAGPAEEMYRKHAAESGKPRNALALAEFLARQKRTREALTVCQAAWPSCPPVEVANTCINVLRTTSAGAEERQLVRRWLEEALKKKDAPVGLLVCLAYLHDLSGDYRQAESVYREALRRDPRNAEALNNLAWLLSYEAGRGDEALRLADRALEVLGPIPELTDTRAVALLSLRRSEEAVTVLQDALDQSRPGAEVRLSLHFHLAQALQMVGGRKKAAEEALKEAKLAGLDENKLHPLERPQLRQLLDATTSR